jgi:hypothetical protein
MIYKRWDCVLRQSKVPIFLLTVSIILAALAPSVLAEEKSDDQGAWQFSVTPYAWFVSMKGKVTVRGLEADVDASFSDIWDELNYGVFLAYEARKGNWGFWGDTMYANLGDSNVDGPNGLGKIDPTVDALWQGLGGFYRVGTYNLADSPGKKPPTVTVDTYIGARYTYLDVSIDFEGVYQGQTRNVDGDKSWVEPLIGVRTLWDLSERWTISLLGDIGGVAFGSDFAWNALGLIGYCFPMFSKENNATVFAGYRALSQDYTDGSGRNKFQWDMTLYGPLLGLRIDF